ncbi:hypothetical protein BC938DRAFT_481959 [Jimgerdemannia flammicorona]|uniref:Uncharacterized protein n=1 Tax=Jimgerdemannia flammicorona TaxID=994334 RepID=A0A433QWL1_9FUNG|nr:hypothetical protein BC938DRAFT_481959 [Jimgerdemannia flammicorona]
MKFTSVIFAILALAATSVIASPVGATDESRSLGKQPTLIAWLNTIPAWTIARKIADTPAPVKMDV